MFPFRPSAHPVRRYAGALIMLSTVATAAPPAAPAPPAPASAPASAPVSAPASAPVSAPVTDALAPGALGLYPTSAFQLTDGACAHCAAPPQALWYFGKETLAVPAGNAVGFDARLRAQDDVRAWLKAGNGAAQGKTPPLLWLGSPQVANGTMAPDAGSLDTGKATLPLALAPKLDSNRSFFNASSAAWFAGKTVKARGTLVDGKFVARTLWPEQYNLTALPPLQPLAAGESLESLVRAEDGGARSAFSARTLWRRGDAASLASQTSLAGKPVMALMLNGAQGDDDEAFGGHFAVATGRFGAGGQWSDWMVNNFYNLGSVSEKGIIAAMLPMDAYMTDVNSGQSWYRPSYMLVAVLKDQRAPALYQEAIARVFNHFYRQDFHYRHADVNCAGISVETLRTLGWQAPRLGAENPLKAAIALPYMTLKERSVASGRSAYDYLNTERTDLFPFAAFNALGGDLLQRLTSGQAPSAGIEAELAQDLEALMFVRIPQLPSSRAFGQAPVTSLDEYMARTPKDRADWKIIPVGPRPFPAALKDPGAPAEASPASVRASYVWAGALVALVAGIAALVGRRRRNRNAARQAVSATRRDAA